jgi:hypothetical protein
MDIVAIVEQNKKGIKKIWQKLVPVAIVHPISSKIVATHQGLCTAL